MSKVFISYRRDDSAGYARSIYRSFEQRWGRERVFMDIDSIAFGDDFEEAIERSFGDCSLVVVVIGKGWAALTDRQGRSRSIRDAHDFPHMEVSAAMKRRIRVIPVLVGGANMPEMDDLPEDLQGLRRRNAMDLRDRTFDRDVEDLMEVVDRLINSATADQQSQAEAAIKGKIAAERDAKEAGQRQTVEDLRAKEAAERRAAEIAAQQAKEAAEQRKRGEAIALEVEAAERARNEGAPQRAKAEREVRERNLAPEATPAAEKRWDGRGIWPKAAGAGIVLAGLAGLFVYQVGHEEARKAQAIAQRVRVEAEAQRERAEQERKTHEAAEAQARELEAKSQKEREQPELGRLAAQKAEEQRLAQEKAERERLELAEQQRLKTVRETAPPWPAAPIRLISLLPVTVSLSIRRRARR